MNLYFRLLWVWWRARFKPPILIGDTIEMTLRVWPNDLDLNGHMNNGRYMTIIDLALVEYLSRAGFLKLAWRHGWRPMLGGSLISFRRGLKPFRRYTLRFSMPCWDARWSYMRFEFLQGGQVMAQGHAKGAIVGSGGIVSSEQTYAALGQKAGSPPFPASVLAWIEADRLVRV
ncbi:MULTISPECIES: thioesterase family protein [unclassified Janthinobacterium]|uniref:thioesterase family protein n=1 Tax=unclassified Janthinobacterium TaxID=2610881 RepID=UPI0003453FAD|nr:MULTISPECIES: thioesterase family protein [unclassified Janthinobacterium]MEC5162728.1 acyl-CoA thioesterase FadM [Janthinobacterium sp. CG_S6]